ncbi:hypothetical protein EJB05_12969, partial [Eragrostis curvula]
MSGRLIPSAGALMFLFEGAFSAALHTGDYLLTIDCFPTKLDSIRQVISRIWKHPNALTVYLVCDKLGQEDVLIEVSRAFSSKIHVDRDKNPDCHYKLSHVALEILTGDPVSRFHIMSFPWLSDRATEILALAQSRQEPEPLIIRPSSQWYAYYEVLEVSVKRRPVLMEPMRDEFGVWHVCLSMHSSREEWSRHWGSFGPDGSSRRRLLAL